MEMKEIHSNGAYRVLKLTLASGETMPRHFAATDAFVIAQKGKAEVVFQDRSAALAPGDTLHIPGREPHSLTASEDFTALVVL
ncbi:hypothetical protein GCM10023188_02400 [Pontibacter saemangeumensis]|uniref:Cupin type-2 domain-containing protein n=1 Tax=Pontibacter saemangeumensis TaxID=1084525 RepID=A0ABP8L8D5_9BACT